MSKPSWNVTEQHPPVWRDPERSLETRVQALVDELTPDEKISLLDADNPAIPRLDIPAYHWWNEALHGVARSGRATVFPQAINLGALFDPALVSEVATAISDEARAKFNEAQRIGNRGQYAGLTFWSPNINLFRDLRWGRGHETYGEDPVLSGKTGTAFVRGLQGNHPRYLKTAAAAKHFAVHSGPEADRHRFDAAASDSDLDRSYLPAFRALVEEAGVAGVMCAYNRVNGIPACAHRELLEDILRRQWGFDGYVVSDCGALADIATAHQYTDSPEEAAALSLLAGVDVNCGSLYRTYLPVALEKGLVAESDIDRALSRSLAILFRLGLFDPTDCVPWSGLGSDAVCSEKHSDLAYEAAARSVVLLKNDQCLPLSSELPGIAVIGPTAASLDVMLGNYHGLNDNIVTLIAGIAGAVRTGTSIEYFPAVAIDRGLLPADSWIVKRCQQQKAIIVCIGLDPIIEGEEGETLFTKESDRLELPRHQVDLVQQLRSGYSGPLVVIVSGGSPRAIPLIHELADAVFWIGYPGQAGGRAVADIVFGNRIPSGHLPVTVPGRSEDIPDIQDYSMHGRTYRYLQTEPLYPFGFGLSYTSFAFREPALDEYLEGNGMSGSVIVSNTGTMPGRVSVQIYLELYGAAYPEPGIRLVDFQSVFLKPGQTTTVAFFVESRWTPSFDKPKNARIIVADACPMDRSLTLGATQPVSASFVIPKSSS